MQQTEHRSFEEADEARVFPNGRAEILKVGGAEVGRLVFEPGWRWCNDVKPGDDPVVVVDRFGTSNYAK
ncbi:MAG: hypothetical protein JOZ04_00675 [Acidimicrobiia bacterium]|nr:hypothetical protein [Acidimicrobiia bacterium]